MLYRAFRCASEGEPPPLDLWLTAEERRQAGALGFPKRRRDWLRGRWVAKRAALDLLRDGGDALPFARLEVATEPSGAPVLRVARGGGPLHGWPEDGPVPIDVSISHSHGTALAVAAPAALTGGLLGVDLEFVEPRSAAFADDFLAAEEIAACERLQDGPDVGITAAWAAKEAVLKALRIGLTVDTRSVVCRPLPDPASLAGWPAAGWQRVELQRLPVNGVPLRALWRRQGGFVEALALRASLPGGAS